ncbi:hypothetical protein NECAME_16320 [Necator americanus]|uniref:Uncharacterized protein n=1 Tax=Necator americanus TaxID=51031 RepID=W2TX66_NECAM|nr:hypothetical protein NECAME_16320 [Necator americanus]ETN86418.1 hypothetical protein NECAME_16320 [Necator americanus]
MCHHRPVCGRDVAVRERFVPEREHGWRVARAGETAHRACIARVEGLLQCLAARAAFYRQFDRGVVDLEIARALGVEPGKFRDELAQLVRAQAGADDRAVQMGVEIDEARTLPRAGEFGLRRAAAVCARPDAQRGLFGR